MNAIDRAALQAAIEMMRNESRASADQIDARLSREDFQQAAEFAAYHCQCKTLRLKPWQPPPMCVQPNPDPGAPDDGIMGWKRAETLLMRMLAAGLSKYEPDPLGALDGGAPPGGRVESERVA